MKTKLRARNHAEAVTEILRSGDIVVKHVCVSEGDEIEGSTPVVWSIRGDKTAQLYIAVAVLSVDNDGGWWAEGATEFDCPEGHLSCPVTWLAEVPRVLPPSPKTLREREQYLRVVAALAWRSLVNLHQEDAAECQAEGLRLMGLVDGLGIGDHDTDGLPQAGNPLYPVGGFPDPFPAAGGDKFGLLGDLPWQDSE